MIGNKFEIDAATVKISHVIFNEENAELTLTCSVYDRGKALHGVPLLRLSIDSDGDDPRDCHILDEYAHFITYPKPIASFREWLILKLEDYVRYFGQGSIKMGVTIYCNNLKSFTESAGLVRQAKAAVNNLKADRKGSDVLARNVIIALGKTPWGDNEFNVL